MDDCTFLKEHFLFLHENDSWKTMKNSSELSIAIDIQYGRFGNNYIILKKILIIALHFKIKKIFLRMRTSNMFAFNSPYITEITEMSDIKNRKNVITPKSGDKLIFCCDISKFLIGDAINERIAKNIIFSSLQCNKSINIDENILCIHLRGGDIFTDHTISSAPPWYRQPPFAWYIACISAHKRRHTNCIVMLISEDRKNPCVEAIIQWCICNNIKYIANINRLEKDYTLLMNAKSLVTSVGSFLLPCLELNKKLAIVYVFNFEWCKDGAYIQHNEWKSTPEQIDRMMNMPISDLALPDDLYAFAKLYTQRASEYLILFRAQWTQWASMIPVSAP